MLSDAYFARFTSQKYRNENAVQRYLIRRFVRQLHGLVIESGPIRSVWEIGVGQGFISGFLSEKFPDVAFNGLDISQSDLQQLNREFPRIKTHCGRVEDLGTISRGASCDLLICAEVLEHLSDPQQAIASFLDLAPKAADSDGSVGTLVSVGQFRAG